MSARAIRAAAAGGLVLAAAALGACRVDVSVGVEADGDGGGRVTATALLDRDAVEQLVGQAAGDPNESDAATRIKVDDLRAAGWTVVGPEPTDGGGLEVVATHRYDDAEEARRLLTEIAGDPGPFRDVSLRQTRSFLKTTTEFIATADLGAGLGSFADPDLREALEATDEAPLGVTEEQLEARFGEAIERMFGLRVAVRLPGDVAANAPAVTDNGAVWTPALGEAAVLEASSERWNVGNIAATATAVLSAVALAALLLRRIGRRPPDHADDDEPGDGDDERETEADGHAGA